MTVVILPDAIHNEDDSFCEKADVEGLVGRGVFTATTKPSDQQCLDWMARVAAEVESKLAEGGCPYTVVNRGNPFPAFTIADPETPTSAEIKHVVYVTTALGVAAPGVIAARFTLTLQRDNGVTLVTASEAVTVTEISGGLYWISFTPLTPNVLYRVTIACKPDGVTFGIVSPSEFQVQSSDLLSVASPGVSSDSKIARWETLAEAANAIGAAAHLLFIHDVKDEGVSPLASILYQQYLGLITSIVADLATTQGTVVFSDTDTDRLRFTSNTEF